MKVQNLLIAAVLAVPVAASAATIDFDTDASSVPYAGLGDSFVAGEYAGVGVTINDSDPSAGSTFVNLINPLNIGTSISGYYVNVGAFDDVATFLDLVFTNPVVGASFDFATPSGDLSVIAFDSGGSIVSSDLVTGADAFINQAGFNVLAGNASPSAGGNIARLLLVAAPNEALIVDNLSFTPIPLPAGLPLLGAAVFTLLGAGNLRRRLVG